MYALIDIDDVLADLMKVWLRRYNKKYKDNLKRKTIQSWDMTKFVKPECDLDIYKFIENPNMYNYIKPYPDALKGINLFRDLGFEIIYATHSTIGTAGRKYKWLQEHKFWNNNDHYFETKSKHLIKADIMIDDAPHNISKFKGFTLLFDQPWNWSLNHPNRVKNWKEIINNIEVYLNGTRTKTQR